MTKLKSVSAAAICSISLLFLPSSGIAAPISGNAMLNAADSTEGAQLIEVRHRGRRHRHCHHHHHHDGAALAAGAIFGLAAGAIAANAAASNNAIAYCSQRYRSYDPVSGTYLGYDGYRHPCP